MHEEAIDWVTVFLASFFPISLFKFGLIEPL